MDCTTEERPRRGRPPATVTMTRAELAAIMGMTPKGISKRIERGQGFDKPRRYEMIKDVTDEPKRKPAPEPYTGPSREEVVSGLLERLGAFRSVETPETALIAAYNAGVSAGRASR